MARLTLEQARMEAGYSATNRFIGARGDAAADHRERSGDPKKWKTQVMGFGTNVQRCGLLQALAFLRRDDEGVYRGVEEALRTHLAVRGFIGKGDDLLEVVRKLPALDYMLVSREALGVALWLKRAAQILCAECA